MLFCCGRVPAEALEDGFRPLRVIPAPPLKLVIAIDGSPSTSVTDPLGQRARAVSSLLSSLPPDASVLTAMFASTVVAFISSPTGQPVFTRVVDLNAAARSQLEQRITNFGPPGTMTDFSDFVIPLNVVRDALTADLSLPESSRYEVIFITGRGPTNDQDQELLCGTVVRGLASLSIAPNDVRIDTVYLNQAQVPTCADPITEDTCAVTPAPSRCPASVVRADEARLRRMAELGRGNFSSYRVGQSVELAGLLTH